MSRRMDTAGVIAISMIENDIDTGQRRLDALSDAIEVNKDRVRVKTVKRPNQVTPG